MELDYWKLGAAMNERGLGLDGKYLLPLSTFKNADLYTPSRMKGFCIEHPNYDGSRCIYKKGEKYFAFVSSTIDLKTVLNAFQELFRARKNNQWSLPETEVINVRNWKSAKALATTKEKLG